MEDEDVTKWTSWGSKHTAKPQNWREALAEWLARFDWAMLLVPGIVVVSLVMILVPLFILDIL